MIRRFIIEAEDSLKGCDEAIEKLEREWGAEEIEPCEDCISREAVLDAVNNVLAPFIPILWGSPMAIPLEIARAINNLPPVTPTIPDVENNYNIGYNCGYADAMSDVAEMRGDEE